LIPYATDTLVGISRYDFGIVLFSFSYTKGLEQELKLTEKQVSRLDSIIKLKNQALTLERKKQDEAKQIGNSLEKIIKEQKKQARKKAIRNTLLSAGLGVGLLVETVLIIQLLK